MAGGLLQLVAYGAQDVYLTGSPKVSFFQSVYRRHTNFSMETIEQVSNGSWSSGGRISVTVARNGDLIGEMFMELVTIRTSDWEWCAERAVQDVELTIGGARIDKCYQRWWRLYSELFMNETKKANYGRMTSASMTNTRVFLPLIFFFNRNPGLYLPLISLQYHELRLDFTLGNSFSTDFDAGQTKIWGNYVYLDTEERRRFAQKGHEYLIEQVQMTGVETLTAGTSSCSGTFRLSFNHPVKELVWAISDFASVSSTDTSLWNFTTEWGLTAGSTSVVPSLTTTGAIAGGLGGGAPSLVSGVMWTEGMTTANAAAGAATVVSGTTADMKLMLNGQDRFKSQSGKYFNQVQPFYYHSGNPYPGIGCYSFALKPEELQPSGTCNFSRIDNAQLTITSTSAVAKYLSLFAVNYNVLRIQSGINLNLSQTAGVKSVLPASPIACF